MTATRASRIIRVSGTAVASTRRTRVTRGADPGSADAKAFLSSREARQMSESELERELHRRGQELVRKLLQEHHDQRSPGETADPAEDASGVECSEPCVHEAQPETSSATMQVVRPGYARRHGLHPLDAALNLLPERYLFEIGRVTIATASRAPPRTPWKPTVVSTSSTQVATSRSRPVVAGPTHAAGRVVGDLPARLIKAAVVQGVGPPLCVVP